MAGFIQEHHVLSMATVQNNTSVSCSLFYLFIPQEQCLIFASDDKSEHIINILQNPNVSGAVHNETKELEHIRGIQMKGMVTNAEQRHEHLYLKEYPYAKDVGNKAFWKIKIIELKYTDNSLGFGQKETWKA